MKVARNVEGYIREDKEYTMDNYSGVMIKITVVLTQLNKRYVHTRDAKQGGRSKRWRHWKCIGSWQSKGSP